MSFKEKKELEELTAELENLENEKSNIEEKLAGGKLNHEALLTMSTRHGEVLKLIDEKEFRWLELTDKA